MVRSDRINFSTHGNNEIVDISTRVGKIVSKSGIKNGIVVITVLGSTAGVTTMEYEPGLVADTQHLFETIAPTGASYQHNLRWGDFNGQSHLRATLLGPSLTLPFVDGKLLLGTWQQIVAIDFDVRPREREVVVQMIGE